jgi:hypothetical protein
VIVEAIEMPRKDSTARNGAEDVVSVIFNNDSRID